MNFPTMVAVIFGYKQTGYKGFFTGNNPSESLPFQGGVETHTQSFPLPGDYSPIVFS